MRTGLPERQVAPTLVHALLRYVRDVGGDEAFAAVAGAVPIPSDQLLSDSRWFSSQEATAIADAAAKVCHDEHIGVRAGAELWAMLSGRDGYLDLVRSAGSVLEAMSQAAHRGTKTSTGRTLQVQPGGEDHLFLVCHYTDLTSAHRFYCGLSAGFYSQVPSAFGMSGNAVELSCQLDGADDCVYRITWRPDLRAAAVDEAALASSSERSQRLIDQLEQVHQLTSQLLSADRVDEVLARITGEAGRAVQAPRYLLAVSVSERDRLRVHQRGFREGTEDAFAQRLLDGTVGEADGVLFADVVHGDHCYGRLAACYSRGSVFGDQDRRLLALYARYAAVVLRHVASLEQAANDRDTARALLDLGRSIAGASSVAEVARRLVDTVPRVVDSDTAALWVWDEARDDLVLASYADVAGSAIFPGPHRLPADEIDDVRAMANTPAPLILDADTAVDPIRGMLTSAGVRQVAVVPVTLHGEFAGIVCAGFRNDLPEQPLLFDRLAGLADHAAVALQSVRLVERISHHASHDTLTGLANRQKLRDEAERALAKAVHTNQRVAMLFIDLDRFKNVNDTLGHAAGDALIQQVAQRIAQVTRPSDVLARLGGDEFLLVLSDIPNSSIAEATAVRVVEALRAPFTLEHQPVYISCSVGIACYPDHGRDYATLLQNADVAMYDAKGAGRNGVAIYAGRQERSNSTSGLELESQLHTAISNEQLEVFYQPQFDLTSGEIVGAEALVRWRHPQHGLLEPGAFLAIAEESGMITAVDRFVRTTAFRQTRRWLDAGHDFRIAVNLSARDLHMVDLSDQLVAEIDAAGLSAARVEVEITDRVAIDDVTLSEVLRRLHAAGLRVAIDDFGTGTSVLGRLHRCPVQTLKIDRSFIRDIEVDGATPVVVEALVGLARSMAVLTVVEGIENVHQLNAVKACGADVAQGFLLSRPVAADQFEKLLQAGRSGAAALLRPAAVASLPTQRG